MRSSVVIAAVLLAGSFVALAQTAVVAPPSIIADAAIDHLTNSPTEMKWYQGHYLTLDSAVKDLKLNFVFWGNFERQASGGPSFAKDVIPAVNVYGERLPAEPPANLLTEHESPSARLPRQRDALKDKM